MKFFYKAVLFDWAYTLVDLVHEDDRAAFAKAFDWLRGKGFSLPDFEEFFGVYHDLFYKMIDVSRESHREANFELALKLLLFRYRIDLAGNSDFEELLTVFYKEIYAPRKLYADTVPALEKLKSLGVRMGVVSNTTNPKFMKDYERSALGLDAYFEFALYSSELPYRKPHPSIFQAAIGRLGLGPRQILFVGDDLQSDVEGAQRVGLPTAWLNRDGNGKAASRNVQPDYEIRSLLDMLDIGPRAV
ncbi:MAG: HAD family hydrolase [Nitrospinae bacterium]|nr:HAD family hydrolase [Nitrospinota bacterium]